MIAVRHQRGMALIMALLCLAVVSVLLTNLTTRGRQDIARLDLLQAETQARFVMRGAEILVQRALTEPEVRQTGLWWQTLRGRPFTWDLEQGSLTLWVEDLRTCFNLNALGGPQAELTARQLEYWLEQGHGDFLQALSPEGFSNALQDWIDADGSARNGSMDGMDFATQDPPRISADAVLADLSEVNWITPLDSQRFRRLPNELCVLPETSPWRLNLNTLPASRLDLMSALFEGEAPPQQLQRLILERPASGYRSAEQVRQTLGENADWFESMGRRLTLTPDLLRIHQIIEIGRHRFRSTRLVQAEGVSGWHPMGPASRVHLLSRSAGDPDVTMPAREEENTP